MTLIVIRHGRTATNAEGRLLGRSDPPLDDTGEAQAAALATALGPLPPTTRVIASPLVRTRQTAAVIAGESNPVEVDERWIELDYGSLEGSRLDEVPADLWIRWRANPAFEPPGGGESLTALGRRVRAGCEAVLADAADRDVIVVTHVSPIKAAVAWALGVGEEITWRLYVAPASVTRIGVRPQGPVLEGFNSAT